MGLFKVRRGPGGRREISQIAPPDEGRNTLPKEEKEEEVVTKVFAEKPKTRPINTGFTGGAAYKALSVGLHKQGILWAQKFIEKLETVEEVDRIREQEVNHPKYNGGRTGILTALDAQAIDIDPQALDKVPEPVKVTEEHVCPHCDFRGGSLEGLTAHISATHDL